MSKILSIREQYAWLDNNLNNRLDLIPNMMEKFNIDMWIVFAKEYNEDPVLEFITPTALPTARRLTCLIFANTKDGFKRFNAGRPNHDLDPYYESVFTDIDDKQFEFVGNLIKEVNPKTIGLNYSHDFHFGDGLTKQIYDDFVECLDGDTINKIVSAEQLCVHFLETRTPQEMEVYPSICKLAMDIVEEGFSFKTITPGVTTSRDLEWWFMQQINDLGLPFWFHPTIDIQRKDSGPIFDDVAIERGDLLHVDIGLKYLGLCTDHQRLAYVPYDNETEVPVYLQEAFKINNHFQDIVCSHYKVGRSGNEVLNLSLKQASDEGIEAMLYSHPIGHYGHGAGPTIGLFNQQYDVKGSGEYPLNPYTCYALELNIKTMIPEFSNAKIMVFSEETVYFDGDKVHYLASGRDKIFLVK